MDLISVSRKYKNIKNAIIITAFIALTIILVIIIKETNQNKKYKKIYTSYENQISQLKQDEQVIEEQKKIEEENARKNQLPQLTEDAKNEFNNLYHSDKKRVFLTFDDGPSKNVTPMVLDTLKQENIKATFFLLGSRVELEPEMAKREYNEGHYLASHGYSHVYSQIYASPQSVLDEYNKSVVVIRNAIGVQEYEPHLFRFPGGYAGGKYASIKKSCTIARSKWNFTCRLECINI